MNKKILYATLWGLLTVAFWSCSDWTEVESKDYFEYPAKDYYASLRDYKKTDHQVAFGWFGNWTGRGASMVNGLMGMPDSVDFVSVWGNWHTLDEHRIADKKQVKEKKGQHVRQSRLHVAFHQDTEQTHGTEIGHKPPAGD